jgi:hypothetical protein
MRRNTRTDRQDSSIMRSLLCRVCIQKFPDWAGNEIYAYNKKKKKTREIT